MTVRVWSTGGVIPLAEARAHVRRPAPVLPPQSPSPLAEALGLVPAEAVGAAEPVPPFDNTAMDGFAVRAADTGRAGRRTLRVVGTLAAGVRGPTCRSARARPCGS